MPRKFYGRILNERMMKVTDKSVGNEHGVFRKGRECVDKFFCRENISGKIPRELKGAVCCFYGLGEGL